MDARSAVVVLLLASLAAAGAVALVSRAPAELRNAEPGPAADTASRGARFTAEQVARGAAYSRPGYLGFVLCAVLELGLLVVLARGPWRALVERVAGLPGGWVVHAAVLALVVAALTWMVALPLGYVRGYVVEHAWGLSTQDLGGWLSDRLRSLAVTAIVAAITAVAFFGIVRWQPRAWWILGWAAFTALTAALVFLWPVVIAPLFNRFTPLEDQALAGRVRGLARAAHLDVDEVLVADASRRTTAENAYVAGLGGTRRVVLYDTLLRAGTEEETLFVVGHELGHEAEGHVVKFLLLSSAGLFVGFAVLAWLSLRRDVWAWAGAAGVGDLKAIPLLLLFATAMSLLSLPVQNLFSRRFEAKADRVAIRLTRDPATATSVLRRLALSNLADLDPPALAVAVLYSHPPIPERIEAIMAVSERPP